MTTATTRSFADIRQALLNRQELALVDVREEAPFAEAHPLFAVNIPLSKLELEVFSRIPRRDTAVTLYDNGEGLAQIALRRLHALGYSDVKLLDGGLQSKAFGELVEHQRATPSLAAEDLKALLDSHADVVVLDARRYDEYQTMSIPGGISVPGAELVLRARAQHHRHPIAGQRRHSQSGACAAQWHYRLAAGRADAGPRAASALCSG